MSRLLRILEFHAQALDLKPSHTVYHKWGKGGKRITLRFSKFGDRNLEAAYSRHYVVQGNRNAAGSELKGDKPATTRAGHPPQEPQPQESQPQQPQLEGAQPKGSRPQLPQPSKSPGSNQPSPSQPKKKKKRKKKKAQQPQSKQQPQSHPQAPSTASTTTATRKKTRRRRRRKTPDTSNDNTGPLASAPRQPGEA